MYSTVFLDLPITRLLSQNHIKLPCIITVEKLLNIKGAFL